MIRNLLQMLIILIICWLIYTDKSNSQNLAYNKPAYQSSTWKWYTYSFTADRAVDDNLSKSVWNGGCSHTATKNDSDWFVVDLLENYFIDYIILYGRDESGYRLNHFIVGLSESFSPSSPPIRGSYYICGQFPKTARNKDILSVNCFYQNKPARFIIIQPKINGPGEMAICNLEVFGRTFRNTSFIGCYSELLNNWIEQRIPADPEQLYICIEKCRMKLSIFASLKNEICRCGNEIRSALPSYFCLNEGQNQQSFPIYTTCPHGTFGLECEYICHCADNAQCDLLSGACPNHKCALNWTGNFCNKTMPVYIGCYYNTPGKDIYYNEVYIDGEILLTNEICSYECLKQNFIYSATQNSTCRCGNEINTASNYDNNCDINCPGNYTQLCGGKEYITVESVCPINFFGYKCQYECHCEYKLSCSYPDGNCAYGCQSGWTGNGCHIPDCSKDNKCGQNEMCQMLNNFTICECIKGFKKNQYYENCYDIDECSLHIDNCTRETEYCTNLEGSYNCSCKTGYYHNYTEECVDINECYFTDPVCNITTERCVNTIGSFRCIPINITESNTFSTGTLTGMMFGAAILAILLLVLSIVLIVVYRKKLILRNSKASDRENKSNKKMVQYETTRKAKTQANKVSKAEYVEFSNMNIYLKDISEFYKNNKQLIETEFSNAPDEITTSGEYGRQKIFKEKNRFKNVVPYDDNRVKLKIINDDPHSDYINASFINISAYENIIATQGPNKFTVNDFWRMVDEQNVCSIVMLCNVTENDKIKCNQYWPIEGSIAYGSVLVEFLEEINWPEYKCRRFNLHTINTPSREIVQWHYVIWPDHGVPCCPASILHFIKRFRNSMIDNNHKAVVHCSAGIGRTGCFLVIDRLLIGANRGLPLDVARCLTEMRMQRPQLVQTQLQYNFIYECLATEAELGSTIFTLEEFKKYCNEPNSANCDNKLIQQYEIIMKDYDEKKSLKREKSNFSATISQDFVHSILSEITFTVYTGDKFHDFWKEISQSDKLVIALSDDKNEFDSKLEEDYIVNYFKICSRIKINYGEILKLSHLENLNAIYENQESAIYANSLDVDNNQIELHHLNLYQNEKINFSNFVAIFELLLKFNENILLIGIDSKLSSLFISAFYILEIMSRKKEVSIFQIVQDAKKKKVPTATLR